MIESRSIILNGPMPEPAADIAVREAEQEQEREAAATLRRHRRQQTIQNRQLQEIIDAAPTNVYEFIDWWTGEYGEALSSLPSTQSAELEHGMSEHWAIQRLGEYTPVPIDLPWHVDNNWFVAVAPVSAMRPGWAIAMPVSETVMGPHGTRIRDLLHATFQMPTNDGPLCFRNEAEIEYMLDHIYNLNVARARRHISSTLRDPAGNFSDAHMAHILDPVMDRLDEQSEN